MSPITRADGMTDITHSGFGSVMTNLAQVSCAPTNIPWFTFWNEPAGAPPQIITSAVLYLNHVQQQKAKQS
jgi:hypothetical protein